MIDLAKARLVLADDERELDRLRAVEDYLAERYDVASRSRLRFEDSHNHQRQKVAELVACRLVCPDWGQPA